MGAEFEDRFRGAGPFSHSAVRYQLSARGLDGMAKGGNVCEQTQDVL
jgi:hypothetical protein